MSPPVVRETKHRTSARSDPRVLARRSRRHRAGGFVLSGTCCEADAVTNHLDRSHARGRLRRRRHDRGATAPRPDLGPDEALVEVSHCGICGTDLHLVLERFARPGSVLGHEWSGTIAALGADVRRLGDRRAGRARPDAGLRQCAARAAAAGRRCACAASRPTCSTSPAARSAATRSCPRRGSCASPTTLSTRAAALTEPTAIALHTVNLAGVIARRPRARHRRRTGRPADHGGAAQSRRARHRRLRARARARASEPSRSARRRRSRPTSCHVRRWAVRSTRRSRSCSSVRATARRRSPRSTSSTTRARSCSSAPGSPPPRVNHNRVIVMEQTLIGAYNYDAAGLPARARPARVGITRRSTC